MSQEIFQIIQQMGLKDVEIQLALQCAPIITRLKISNLLIVESDKESKIKEILKDTEISYFILLTRNNKTTFLLYRADELEQYFLKKEVKELLKVLGYKRCELKHILFICQRRYKLYMTERDNFPHEIGLLLGYPIEDVHGFIQNEGKNFLYSGYWKVYKNISQKIELFEKFDCAKENMIKMIACGMKIQQIIQIYSKGELQQAAV